MGNVGWFFCGGIVVVVVEVTRTLVFGPVVIIVNVVVGFNIVVGVPIFVPNRSCCDWHH